MKSQPIVETMLAFRAWYMHGLSGREVSYPITIHAWTISEAMQTAAKSRMWTGEIELVKNR